MSRIIDYLVPSFVTDSVFFDEHGNVIHCEPLKTIGKTHNIMIPPTVLRYDRFDHAVINSLIFFGRFVWQKTIYVNSFGVQDANDEI